MTKEEREKLYTLRWYVRERWNSDYVKDDVLDILTQLLDEESLAENRPSVTGTNQKLLYCPFAQRDFPKARTRGNYARGYPRGAVVHYTAGRHSSLSQGLNYQVQEGYLYFLIDQEGNIGQNFALDSWGYHAGKSSYKGLSGNVSNELVGIEITSAGLLTPQGDHYKSWFGTQIEAKNVSTITRQTDNQAVGHYEKYTKKQEESLTKLILWLHSNNPDVFSLDLVVGHDEVSPTRKFDPGGALSMTMPEYRKQLKSLVK